MSFLELLRKEHQFPTHYLHKIIGPNNDDFRKAIAGLILTTNGLIQTGEKLSQNGAHVSFTFEFYARAAEEIVFLVERSQKIDGVHFVL